MSVDDSEQTEIEQFRTALEVRDERPSWEPTEKTDTDTGSRERCACGETVTKQFARVFGGNDDEIEMCPECASYRDMKTGAINRGRLE